MTRGLLGFTKGCAVQARRGGCGHQGVVAGVELDPVDAAPETVVALELRREHIGQPRMGLHFATAHLLTQGLQRRRVQRWRVERQRRSQRLIARKHIHIHQRIWLIKNLVRRGHREPPDKSCHRSEERPKPGRRGTGSAGPPSAPLGEG
jgi:hypothetical protein